MKDIYVNKEGVICACTVPFPNEKDFSGDQWKENAALQACKESAVPFEDQDSIKRLLGFKTDKDTFYELDVAEVIQDLKQHGTIEQIEMRKIILQKEKEIAKLKRMLRETVFRAQLALPEDIDSIKWFEDGLSIHKSDFFERLQKALNLGNVS